MRENRNVVFVLGAGASAGFQLPVMRDFMATARRRYFIRLKNHGANDFVVKAYLAMFAFYEHCLKSSHAFRRDWDNIEELYTQADLRRLAQLSEDAIEICKQIAWSIWDVYREVDTASYLSTMCDSLRKASLDPVFITTNYDTAIERQLRQKSANGKMHHYHYPGFEMPTHPSTGDFSERLLEDPNTLKSNGTSVPIVKLHGSVNWFNANDEHWIALTDCGRTSVVNLPAFSSEHLEGGFSDQGLRNINATTVTPAIIPPMLGKSSNYRIIANQWKVAVDALSKAKQVWVIGYSFPPTDTFMSRLLAEGIQDNRDLDIFCIIDLQSEKQWRTRIDSLFNPTFVGQRLEFWQISALSAYSHFCGSDSPKWIENARSQAQATRSRAAQEQTTRPS